MFDSLFGPTPPERELDVMETKARLCETADITITITADEDDLRYVASYGDPINQGHFGKVARAITAALPKPRIHPQPGDVLRRKSDGRTTGAFTGQDGSLLLGGIPIPVDRTLDPDEWEIVTKAELDEAFARKRGAS